MRIQWVLETVASRGGMGEAILVILATMALLVVCLALFRLPFIYCVILLVGIASNVRFGSFIAIGMVGRYLMIAILAVMALVDRRPFKMNFVGWAYLTCVFLITVQFPRAPSLGDSLVRILYYICSFFAFIMLTEKVCKNPYQFRKAVCWMIGLLTVTVWIQFPLMGRDEEGRYSGIFLNVANLQNAMMLAIVLITYAMVAGYIKKFTLLLGIATLIAASGLFVVAGGRTAILTALLTIPFLLRMRPGRGLIIAIIASGLGLLILSQFLPQIPEFQAIVPHLLSTDSSGRLEMWANIWNAICESPVFGHGLDQNLVYGYSSMGNQAHNLFLQVAYDCGIPTAVFVLLMLMAAVINAWRQVARLPVGPLRQMASLGGAMLMMVVFPSFLGMGLLSLDLPWSLLCIGLGMQITVSQRIKAEHLEPDSQYGEAEQLPSYGDASAEVGS